MMKLQTQSKAAAVLVSGLGIALMTGSAAYAYWTTTGSGTGSASATSSQDLEVDDPAVSGLYPTGQVSGSFTVTNPNPFKVQVTDVVKGAVTVDAGHSGCNVASVSFTPGTLPATPIAADGGTATISFTADMTNAANPSCQGATFSLPLTVNAQSAS